MLLPTPSMPSVATASRSSSSSNALGATTMNARRRRRPASSMLSLSAMPSSSAAPRAPAPSRLFPGLSLRSGGFMGRVSSLVPLNAFDRDTYRRVPLPPNPPPLTEPAPPPPPPPPPRNENGVPSGGGKWFVAFFAALALWYGYVLSEDVVPVETGADDGFSYIRTKGGNKVLIAKDEAGRTFLVDQDANLYYDSGIEEVGWYIVAGRDGEVTNLFIDGENDGKLSRRVVGNIRDLRQVDAEALAGFKLDDLDREEYLAGTDGATGVGTIVGFGNGETDQTSGDNDGDENEFELPPNAPLTVGADGAIKGPPVLEEGVLTLKQKNEGAKKLKFRKGDKLDALVSLFDSAVESGAVGAAVGNPLAERGAIGLPGMPPEILERGK